MHFYKRRPVLERCAGNNLTPYESEFYYRLKGAMAARNYFLIGFLKITLLMVETVTGN